MSKSKVILGVGACSVWVLSGCGGGSDGISTGSVSGAATRVKVQAVATATSTERMSNASFETPQLPAGTFVSNPTNVGGWAFTPVAGRGNAVLSSTDSAFTKQAPSSGAGTQMVALQGLASVSQTLQLDPDDEIWVRATQRANYNPAPGAFMVLLDDTFIYGSKTRWRLTSSDDSYVQPPSGGWHLYRFAPFSTTPIAAGAHKVAITAGGYYRYGEYPDHTVLIDDIRVVKVATTKLTVDVPGGGFEEPVLPVGTYKRNAEGTGWKVFSGNFALARNDSAFFKSPFGGSAAPSTSGNQVLAAHGWGEVAQSIHLEPGDVLTFKAQLRQPLSAMFSTPDLSALATNYGLKVIVNGVEQPSDLAAVKRGIDMGKWSEERIELSSVSEPGSYTIQIMTKYGPPYPDWSILVDDIKIERLQLK